MPAAGRHQRRGGRGCCSPHWAVRGGRGWEFITCCINYINMYDTLSVLVSVSRRAVCGGRGWEFITCCINYITMYDTLSVLVSVSRRAVWGKRVRIHHLLYKLYKYVWYFVRSCLCLASSCLGGKRVRIHHLLYKLYKYVWYFVLSCLCLVSSCLWEEGENSSLACYGIMDIYILCQFLSLSLPVCCRERNQTSGTEHCWGGSSNTIHRNEPNYRDRILLGG